MKTLIAGWPRTGKTTRANALDSATEIVRHTDDLIPSQDWSAISETVSYWFDEDYSVIEGVAVPRALRKWLARNKSGKPCDELVYLTMPHVSLSAGQAAMGKGCDKVFNEIKGELIRRGVKIIVNE